MRQTQSDSCVTNTNRKEKGGEECRWRRQQIPGSSVDGRRSQSSMVLPCSRGRKWALSRNRFGDKRLGFQCGGGGSTNGGDRLGPRVGGGAEVQLSGSIVGRLALQLFAAALHWGWNQQLLAWCSASSLCCIFPTDRVREAII